METFYEMFTRLMEVHDWPRRMCVLAARLYLGIDKLSDYQAGHMTQPDKRTPLLTQGEYHEIVSAW